MMKLREHRGLRSAFDPSFNSDAHVQKGLFLLIRFELIYD